VLHRRGIVILLVDRTCPLPRRKLVSLAGRHEVVVLRIGDAMLDGQRLTSPLPAIDAESGHRFTVARAPRSSERQSMPGVDIVELRTDEDYLPAVQALLERRERRRAH
jgi:hypothetical protein